MADAGPSTNRLKRQYSLTAEDNNEESLIFGDRKRVRHELCPRPSLTPEYETLQLGLLSARSPSARALDSPRSAAEISEVQRRDAELEIAIRQRVERGRTMFTPPFPERDMYQDRETVREIKERRKMFNSPSLTRSMSVSSITSSYTAKSEPPKLAENSASYHLAATKTLIDFSLPTDFDAEFYLPVACSLSNVLFFTRGNRVHFKNLQLQTSEDITQLFRLQEKHGDVRNIECGGIEQSNKIALSTSTGYILLWDIAEKKQIMSWHTDAGAMAWNGQILTIGEVKGTVRFFDTRISPTKKMKGEARRLIRHQSRITRMKWNDNKKFLATADDSGTVHCWDDRQRTPLDVGEFVQRRKKIQHDSAVTALAWCPWQPKFLGTGDANGIVRLWNIDPNDNRSSALTHHTVHTGARVNGLHFSSYCKEMITIHGKANPNPAWTSNPLVESFPSCTTNSIVAHTFPNPRHIKTLAVSDKVVAGSVMNANGTKVITAVPEEGKIKLWDVWAKPPPLKRQPSLMEQQAHRSMR
ncbi:cell division control protein [Moniliophthora roreri MCA 2997]|uniref:Cell division control protein n=1 Tax=Moniliophthora roreri (strain MCA 2997) TaxID=1381753 RepID=V2YNN0_MONRO|nr:cell division control protein [Moniliophthora roreri MCA 2997]